MPTSYTMRSANHSTGLQLKCGTMKRSARSAQSLHRASPIVTNLLKFTFVRLPGTHLGTVTDANSLEIANKSRSQFLKLSIHTMRFDIGKIMPLHAGHVLVRAQLGPSVCQDISRYILSYSA